MLPLVQVASRKTHLTQILQTPLAGHRTVRAHGIDNKVGFEIQVTNHRGGNFPFDPAAKYVPLIVMSEINKAIYQKTYCMCS